MNIDEVSILYDKYINTARQLMQDKNHDYGEAWRSMSQESFVDLILMKLQRIRQILTNEGKPSSAKVLMPTTMISSTMQCLR